MSAVFRDCFEVSATHFFPALSFYLGVEYLLEQPRVLGVFAGNLWRVEYRLSEFTAEMKADFGKVALSHL